MIVVVGASGTIGSELVRQLSGAGVSARALSRRPEHGPDLPGIEWAFADPAQPPTLTTAFKGVESLFLLTGNSREMVHLQTNAITAALQAGVDHIVKVSALGSSDHSTSVIGLWHYNIEQTLTSRPVISTILRPHHFMQNLLSPDTYDRRAGVVRAPSGDGRIPFIDARDVALVAAFVLTRPEHRSQKLTLTGPKAISYAEAVTTASEIIGRDLRYEQEDMDQAWSRLRQAGQPPWLAASQLEIARYHRAGGPTEKTTDTVERLTGKAPRSMADFVKDHRREF